MYQHFGCYNDTKNIMSINIGDFSHEDNPINACAKAVNKEGYGAFSVQNGSVCSSGSGNVEQFYETKKSSLCKKGFGGHGIMDVYVFSDIQGENECILKLMIEQTSERAKLLMNRQMNE